MHAYSQRMLDLRAELLANDKRLATLTEHMERVTKDRKRIERQTNTTRFVLYYLPRLQF